MCKHLQSNWYKMQNRNPANNKNILLKIQFTLLKLACVVLKINLVLTNLLVRYAVLVILGTNESQSSLRDLVNLDFMTRRVAMNEYNLSRMKQFFN